MQSRALLSILFVFVFVTALHAADDALAAVRRADAARIEATIANDPKRLGELLTDDLVYVHSDGPVQTKAEFLQAVTTNQIKYESVDYEDVKLVETAPHVVTMTGRVRLKASQGDVRVEFIVRFLAVWREEAGQWRLHAYLSTRSLKA